MFGATSQTNKKGKISRVLEARTQPFSTKNHLEQAELPAKLIDPLVLKARKRLDINRPDINTFFAQINGLSKAAIKKILNKVLKRNPRILLPADSDFYSYGKSLAPLIKSIKVIPKKKEGFMPFPSFENAELKNITKMIKACRRLEYLDILKISDLKSSFIKPLRRLMTLERLAVEWKIEITGIAFPFCTYLKQLKKLHLRLCPYEQGKEDQDDEENASLRSQKSADSKESNPNLSKFSSEMSSCLKNLKHLELHYIAHKVPQGQTGIEMLLHSINPEKVHDFSFSFHIKSLTLDVQKLLPLLQKVDHIGFFADRIYGLNDSLNVNRRLFFFISENCKINDADIIKNCSSLRKLSVRTSMLSSIQGDKTQNLAIPSTVQSLNLMLENHDDSLLEKELSSWLLALRDLPIIRKFNLTICPWGSQSYQKVQELHQHASLKNLETYQLTISDYSRMPLKRDMLEDVSELLKEIGDVPDIGFRFKRANDDLNSSSNFWKALHENKNLKSLFFSIPEGRNVYPMEFPYQRLANFENLEEFILAIPPPLNKAEILRKLPKIPKLKVCIVKSSEPHFWDQELYLTDFA